MKMYDAEWRENRKKHAVDLIREMEVDEIGFSVSDIWQSVHSLLLDLYCSDKLATEIATEAFKECGYSVKF